MAINVDLVGSWHDSLRRKAQNSNGLSLRRGISLIEVIVAIAVISILLAILLPAIGSARESARRMQCQSNLKQLGLGLASYETTHRYYPDGLFWARSLLPDVGYGSTYMLYQPNVFPHPSTPFVSLTIPIYNCPSDPAKAAGTNSYMGCYGGGVLDHGFNGIFNLSLLGYPPMFPVAPVSSADVPHGLSNTVAFGEVLHSDGSYHRLRVRWQLPRQFGLNEMDALADYCESIPENAAALGWMGSPADRGVPWCFGSYGEGLYNHILPPNRPSCNNGTNLPYGAHTAGSFHGAGANVAYADGHVSFASASIDRRVWRRIGSRVDRVVGTSSSL